MIRPCSSKTCIIAFAFVFLIGYFVIVQQRLASRCSELKDGLKWSDELSILERKVCGPEGIAENEILDEIRAKIRMETSEYDWNITGVRKVEDLVLENNGKPHRTLFVTGWRTGNTVLNDVFLNLPASFYYHEPLRYLNTTQVRRPPLSDKAVKIIKSIFECNSYDVGLNFIREKRLGYSRSFFKDLGRVWDYMGGDIDLIFDPIFMEKICRLFPFQIIKETVVRVDVLKQLLEDEQLNLHMVILVRDPRGMLQSRREDALCLRDPECIMPEFVCADMVSDFYAAGELLHRFPWKTRILRYEDLALNPYDTTSKLLDFLKIDMTKPVEDILMKHPNTNKAHVAFDWRTLMDFKRIEDIQVACRGAMELWGYLPAHNESHLISRSFNPLGKYSTRLRNN